MKIEENWEDVNIYYVEFEVEGKTEKKRIKKYLVFNAEISEDEISALVVEKFKYVLQVIHIDFCHEFALKLKHTN